MNFFEWFPRQGSLYGCPGSFREVWRTEKAESGNGVPLHGVPWDLSSMVGRLHDSPTISNYFQSDLQNRARGMERSFGKFVGVQIGYRCVRDAEQLVVAPELLRETSRLNRHSVDESLGGGHRTSMLEVFKFKQRVVNRRTRL
jgi:hypothetical protein